MSKSMVLPKPWQRGQAPNGLLKLKRRGSGSTKVDAAVLAGEVLAEAQALAEAPAAGGFEDDFAGFAIADFDGIDHALAQVGTGLLAGMTRRSTRTKTGFEKSISSSDSGVENSKVRPAWNRRLKPFLRRSNR